MNEFGVSNAGSSDTGETQGGDSRPAATYHGPRITVPLHAAPDANSSWEQSLPKCVCRCCSKEFKRSPFQDNPNVCILCGLMEGFAG